MLHSSDRQAEEFLASVCSSTLSSYVFLRDQLDGMIKTLAKTNNVLPDSANPKLMAHLAQQIRRARGNLVLFKKTLLFLTHLCEDSYVASFLADPRRASAQLRRKLAALIVKPLERLEESAWGVLRLDGSRRYIASLTARLMKVTFEVDKDFLELGASSLALDLDVTFETDDKVGASALRTFSEDWPAKSFSALASRTNELFREDRLRQVGRKQLFDDANLLFWGEETKTYARERLLMTGEASLEDKYRRAQGEGGVLETVASIPGYKFTKKASGGAESSSKGLLKSWRTVSKYFQTMEGGCTAGVEDFVCIKMLENDLSCARIMLSCNEQSPYAFG